MQTGMTITESHTKPILYSFRRCPYAIRARMALSAAQIEVAHREVLLKDKPAHMLAISPKGTVPVLLLPPDTQGSAAQVLDESLDIVFWALRQHDPQGWLADYDKLQSAMDELIGSCDQEFKTHLDGYKYAEPDQAAFTFHRAQGESFLRRLEGLLAKPSPGTNLYLFGERVSVADVCVFPFVRQFAFVDKHWFNKCPYPRVVDWLERWLVDSRFLQVMRKHPQWKSQAPQAGVN